MFIHAVLFEIKPKEVPKYHRDNKMWAGYAKKAKGFASYFTFKRQDAEHQYASVYIWENRAQHNRFMKKFHDWLVSKSSAKVKVLGYYNLKSVAQIK